jgi:ABC-type multidrug transport system fused ATPase/permease subunit
VLARLARTTRRDANIRVQEEEIMGNSVQFIGWTVVIALVGGVVGIALVLVSSAFLPWFIGRMTPAMDEEKEIARGNVAAAEYFGRVVAASILGMSAVVAAAVLGAIIAVLHS